MSLMMSQDNAEYM